MNTLIQNTIPLEEAEKAIQVKLPVLSVSELMAIDLPDRPRFLPWLPKGGLVQVFGPRGIGKTYFTLGLAIALVTGDKFLRWDISEATGVLIVDGEMALGDLRERLTTLLPGKPASSLEILSHEHVFRVQERDLNLGIPEWQDGLKAYLENRPDIGVIVLDNLSCLLPGVAEDKRDDWAVKVLPFLIWLRNRGVAVVLVHHAGKGGEQRGTSAREDSLDTVIRLGRVAGHDALLGVVAAHTGQTVFRSFEPGSASRVQIQRNFNHFFACVRQHQIQRAVVQRRRDGEDRPAFGRGEIRARARPAV